MNKDNWGVFALLGILGGLLGSILGYSFNNGSISQFTIIQGTKYFFSFPLIWLAMSIIVGEIGGSIVKKWWGALCGGFFVSVIIYLGFRLLFIFIVDPISFTSSATKIT